MTGLKGQGAASRMAGEGTSSDELSGLKFGYPGLIRMPGGGDVMVVFWCKEEGINNVRWVRVGVS